ncbi:MAG TPA: ABC transporter ATP-binding protein [Bryobacteraceae bacterium]|nr:ABC transporter ATP-binding protein [Bryobacteraceae bacterium]
METRNSAAPAIIVENVSKVYPRQPLLSFLRDRSYQVGTQALREISFQVREGETVGLLGPNGAGKTTLLKIICSLLYPSSGRVLVHGLDLVKESLKARSMMGLITCEDRSFYWRITGRQNLDFFATLYGIPRKKAAGRIEILLETLGLTYAADRPFHSYSSGMKQKLAIARGLLGDPRVVLYDEPTRSLDPLSTQNIHQWILANRADSPRTAHLIATNQLREAELLCDRVVIINRGVVIAHGTIGEIRQRFRTEQHVVHRIRFRGPRAALPQADFEHGLVEVGEEERDGDFVSIRAYTREGSEGLSAALSSILGNGGVVVECHTEEVAFDEVFCALVQRQYDESHAVAAGAKS